MGKTDVFPIRGDVNFGKINNVLILILNKIYRQLAKAKFDLTEFICSPKSKIFARFAVFVSEIPKICQPKYNSNFYILQADYLELICKPVLFKLGEGPTAARYSQFQPQFSHTRPPFSFSPFLECFPQYYNITLPFILQGLQLSLSPLPHIMQGKGFIKIGNRKNSMFDPGYITIYCCGLSPTFISSAWLDSNGAVILFSIYSTLTYFLFCLRLILFSFNFIDPSQPRCSFSIFYCSCSISLKHFQLICWFLWVFFNIFPFLRKDLTMYLAVDSLTCKTLAAWLILNFCSHTSLMSSTRT